MTIPIDKALTFQPSPRTISLGHLYRYMQVYPTAQEVQQLFTHHSVNNCQNNSRYIFLGMYAFKGLVAKWVARNISGTGTQLQHFLGNTTSDNMMTKLFSHWQLAIHVPTGAPPLPHHLYTQAVLGYLVQHAAPEKLDKLIYRFFILPNDHHLPDRHIIDGDPWQQLVFLLAQQQQKTPRLKHEILDNGMHHFSLWSGTQLLGTHTSASYKYARKKAIQLALKAMVTQANRVLLTNPQYQQVVAEIQTRKQTHALAEKELRLKKWQERQKQKKQDKEAQKEQARLNAQEEDHKRRMAKQQTKERKKKKESMYRIYTAEEIANMTASKRRNLEDRGIIPKR